MKKLQIRLIGLGVGFVIGLMTFYLYQLIAKQFFNPEKPAVMVKIPATDLSRLEKVERDCKDYFQSPREIVDKLTSKEVEVRRDINFRLAIDANKNTTFYNYQLDHNYPEQVDNVFIRYANLDKTPADEAIITFKKQDVNIALILKQNDCGWQLIDRLQTSTEYGSWAFEPWLETVAAVNPDCHEVLIHDATTEAGQYFGRATLYKLIDDKLMLIASFPEEEIIHSNESQYNSDQNYKDRSISKYFFINSSETSQPFIELETTREIVKYYGPTRRELVYSTVDGRWHNREFHWHTRSNKQIKMIEQKTKYLIWNEESQGFHLEKHSGEPSEKSIEESTGEPGCHS